MINIPREKQQKILLFIAFVTVALSLVAAFGFIALQAYIRWSVNRDFTFLGGNGLEVLVIAAFSLLIALLYLYRPSRGE